MQSPRHTQPTTAIVTAERVPLRLRRSLVSPWSVVIISFIRSTWYGGGGKNKETHIAETCVLIHGLDSGGYNSKLFGILLRKLKAAPVDVISNKGHVDLCTWFVARNFHDGVYLVWAFWWLAMASAGTSVCKLLRSLLWPVLRCPAEGSAEEDQNSCLSLYTMAPRQGQETRHSTSYTKYREPTFDLSSFKSDYLVWLILHIIQNRRSTAHWPF